VARNGAVRPEHLALGRTRSTMSSRPAFRGLSDGQVTLTLAGFKPAYGVAPIGVGRQRDLSLARAQGAARSFRRRQRAKAPRRRELGFEMWSTYPQKASPRRRRITAGKGVDIVIESMRAVDQIIEHLARGVLITLGYSAGRKTTIDGPI